MAIPLLTSIDGIVTPSGDAMVPLPDDGVFRGDGVFEVLRAYGPNLFTLEDHLDRLGRSAASIDLDIDRAAIESETLSLLERAEGADCLVRMVATRAGRRIITLENLLDHPRSISLATVTYSPSVILNGVKSLSYAANMQATRVAKKAGAMEALLVMPDGSVLEAPTSTLFWVSRGKLRTTALEIGVLDSITRDRIIEAMDVEVGRFQIDDVMKASEAFLASTTREVQPVDSIDGQAIPVEPGEMTKASAAAFTAALNSDLG
ncbi:MAG: aminotransferase class IV [Solirubrobacterales bacterium]